MLYRIVFQMNPKHFYTPAGIDSFNENIKLQIIGLFIMYMYMLIHIAWFVCK